MKTQKSRSFRIIYILATIIIAILGFYFLVHFMPEVKDQKFGDLNLLAQIIWGGISLYVVLTILPDRARWNALFWTGAAIAITAMALLADNVPELAAKIGIADIDPVSGSIALLIGCIFVFKGFLAYKET